MISAFVLAAAAFFIMLAAIRSGNRLDHPTPPGKAPAESMTFFRPPAAGHRRSERANPMLALVFILTALAGIAWWNQGNNADTPYQLSLNQSGDTPDKARIVENTSRKAPATAAQAPLLPAATYNPLLEEQAMPTLEYDDPAPQSVESGVLPEVKYIVWLFAYEQSKDAFRLKNTFRFRNIQVLPLQDGRYLAYIPFENKYAALQSVADLNRHLKDLSPFGIKTPRKVMISDAVRAREPDEARP